MLAELPLRALNRLLASETWACKLLAAHAGQVAWIDIAGVSLRFAIDDEGRLLPASTDNPPHVSIHVPAEALGKLAEGPEALRTAAHIEGNAGFAETLATLIQHLRPDPAAWLAPWLGDVLAYRLTRSARALGMAGIGSGQRLGNAGLEILRQTNGPLPSRAEFDSFCRDLAAFKTRLDALSRL